MLPSSETFEIHNNVIWVFCQKEKNSACEGMPVVPWHDGYVSVNVNFQNLH